MEVKSKFNIKQKVFWLSSSGIRPGMVVRVVAEEYVHLGKEFSNLVYKLDVGSQYDKIKEEDLFKTRAEAGMQMLKNNGLDVGLEETGA